MLLKKDWQIMRVNSSATFDVLYIASSTKHSYPDLSFYELNFLSYFACLMSLYDGNPTTEWNYSFFKNNDGVPVSSAIAEAVMVLSKNGEIHEESSYYEILPNGEYSLEVFKEFSIFNKRIKYLQAACDCLLMESIVSLSSILSSDPVISESASHTLKRLNSKENVSLVSLHNQFETIEKVVGLQKELFVPAYMWIQYLKLKKRNDT